MGICFLHSRKGFVYWCCMMPAIMCRSVVSSFMVFVIWFCCVNLSYGKNNVWSESPCQEKIEGFDVKI